MKQLTVPALRTAAPAAFTKAHGMSSRYVQVNTADVVSHLADTGFVPVNASQDHPLRRDPAYVTHQVTLRHTSVLSTDKVGDQVPQIVIMNSHNGRTKLRLYVGLYRLVCSNGLVIGNDIFRYEIRHVGNALFEAHNFVTEMADRAAGLGDLVREWSGVELSNARAINFARKAAELRFGERAGAYDPNALLAPRREEDAGDDLWRIFNRVQENTTKGGLQGVGATGRAVSSRELTSVSNNVAYNYALWDLAESYAA